MSHANPHLNARIDHVAIRVADLERSVRFYEQAFGARSIKTHNDDEAIGAAHLVRLATGACIELFQAGRGQASHGASDVGIAHFSVSVPNVDESYERATAAGAASLCPPTDTEIPAHPGILVRYAFVFGLNGELFELINSQWSEQLFQGEDRNLANADEGSDEDDWPW